MFWGERGLWLSPSARLCVAVFGIVVVADAMLVLVTPVVIAPGTFSLALSILSCIGFIALVCLAATWKLRGDESRPARAIKAACRGCIEAAAALAAFVCLSFGLAIACFASNTLAMPLQDSAMTAIDAFFGFDWIAITTWVSARPLIAQALAWSYSSCMLQMMGVALLLLATSRVSDLWDFLAILMLGLALTILVAAVVPAASPAVHLQPASSLLDAMAQFGATYNYADQFAALRDGKLTLFVAGEAKGILTFPTYHVVVALVLTYAVRHWWFLLWPATGLNALVIISTVPIGGHYVIDIVGGVLVFASCVVVVDWVNRPRRLFVGQTVRSAVPLPVT